MRFNRIVLIVVLSTLLHHAFAQSRQASPKTSSSTYTSHTGMAFHPKRLKLKNAGIHFKPFNKKIVLPLQEAIQNKMIKSYDDVFMLEIEHHKIAFPLKPMAYHHIVQGSLNEIAYIFSFCAICNSGMFMSPVLNGDTLNFKLGGIYNGVLVLQDKETDSYWDHITGECLYGHYQGEHLEIIGSNKLLLASQALESYPDLDIIFPKQTLFQKMLNGINTNSLGRKSKKGHLPLGFRGSMSTTDSRRAEMDMGLGIWSHTGAKYYPIEILSNHNNAIIDTFDNKTILVYIDPLSFVPSALFTSSESIEWKENSIFLDNGQYIKNGQLFDANGAEIPSEQPHYLFARWYGFSAYFPNCLVFNP